MWICTETGTFKLNTDAVWSDLCIWLHELYLLIQFYPNIYLHCLLWTDLCWISILLGSTRVQVYLSIYLHLPRPHSRFDRRRMLLHSYTYMLLQVQSLAGRGASVEFKFLLMQRHTGGPSGISWPAMQTRGSFAHKHLPSNLANTRFGQL